MVLFRWCGLSHIKNITLNHQIVQGFDPYPPWVGSITKWMLAQELHLCCGIRQCFSAVSLGRGGALPRTVLLRALLSIGRKHGAWPGKLWHRDDQQTSAERELYWAVALQHKGGFAIPYPCPVQCQNMHNLTDGWSTRWLYKVQLKFSWGGDLFFCKYQPGFP